MKKIGSKKAISAIIPLFVVVALILVILAGYYVATVLPGSLPTTTTQIYTSYVSDLTTLSNLTSTLPQGVSASPEHSVVSPIAIVYIVDGASLGRYAAFNPSPTTLYLGTNGTIIFKNSDGVSNQIEVSSCTPTPQCSTNVFKSGTLGAAAGAATGGSCFFSFNETGTYQIVSATYSYENTTVTVDPPLSSASTTFSTSTVSGTSLC